MRRALAIAAPALACACAGLSPGHYAPTSAAPHETMHVLRMEGEQCAFTEPRNALVAQFPGDVLALVALTAEKERDANGFLWEAPAAVRIRMIAPTPIAFAAAPQAQCPAPERGDDAGPDEEAREAEDKPCYRAQISVNDGPWREAPLKLTRKEATPIKIKAGSQWTRRRPFLADHDAFAEIIATAPTGATRPDRLALRLPPVEIDGETRAFAEPILFERRVGRERGQSCTEF